ncbi:MAG TPA: flagellar basal body-associated FliL family protein [Opitutaceae bacterium]|nr:flagellar basal body-associated FliL family protein [Opitutaceae bacterium]
MSADKNDKPEAAAAAPAASAPADGAAPKGGGIMGFLPLIIALVLAPVISWVVAEFVLLPRFRAQLTSAVGASSAGAASGEHAAAEPAAEPKHEAKAEPKHEPKKAEGKKSAHGGAPTAGAEGPGSYRFEDVVVNLSGTMGTRYLKTSFLVTGKENLRELFEERQPQLLDATLNTLGSLTLADLEEVGSRNLIRARLIAAYNEVIGVRIVDQIYFSDFVVQ